MFRAGLCILTLGFFGGFSSEEVQFRKTLIKKLNNALSPTCENDRDLLIDCLSGDFNKKFDTKERARRFKDRNQKSATTLATSDNSDSLTTDKKPCEEFEDSIEELDLRGLRLSSLSEKELKLILSIITSIETMAVVDLRENGFDFSNNSSTVVTHMAEVDFVSEFEGRYRPLKIK